MNRNYPAVLKISVWTDTNTNLLRTSNTENPGVGEGLAEVIHWSRRKEIGLQGNSYEWDFDLNNQEEKHKGRFDNNKPGRDNYRPFRNYYYRRVSDEGL